LALGFGVVQIWGGIGHLARHPAIHTHTHTHTQARTHARTHARTDTHTHTHTHHKFKKICNYFLSIEPKW
jgi:ABC-type nickel/cobalt efflux system permease component RcnA